MIADILITTKGRPHLLYESITSLRDSTSREDYRLTVIDDTGKQHVSFTKSLIPGWNDHYIRHEENMGLGPSINQGLAYIDALKKWDDAPVPLTVYLQDDILYTKDWLKKLSTMFFLLEKQHHLAFASGIESIEHPMRRDLGNGMILKDWLRMTCLLARHETWMSMWPIPKIDPETGRERGRPHDGLGSSVDWWFIRNHEKSVCRSGRTNLVIPGLLQHMGYKDSTWLKRELPESDSDKKKIELTLNPPKPTVEMVPCGNYGCTTLRPAGHVFCGACYREYREDPDAFK